MTSYSESATVDAVQRSAPLEGVRLPPFSPFWLMSILPHLLSPNTKKPPCKIAPTEACLAFLTGQGKPSRGYRGHTRCGGGAAAEEQQAAQVSAGRNCRSKGGEQEGQRWGRDIRI